MYFVVWWLKFGKWVNLIRVNIVLIIFNETVLTRFSDYIKTTLKTDDFMMITTTTIITFIIFSLLIAADTFFGIMAAKYENQKITPSRGLMSVYRLTFFSFWLLTILALQTITIISGHHILKLILSYINYFAICFIILWEFKSIGNNIYRRFGKRYAFFDFIDKLIDFADIKFSKYLQKKLCPEEENKNQV